MNEKIKEIRAALRMNQTDFAKRLGLTQTALSMIESGKSTLTNKNIKFICTTFHVNESWFRTGAGSMFNDSPYTQELIELLAQLTPDTQQYLLLMARELIKTQNKLLNKEDA